MTTVDRRQYVLSKCDGRMFSSEVVRELCIDLESLESQLAALKQIHPPAPTPVETSTEEKV